MGAHELNIMVNTMRKYMNIGSRAELQNIIYALLKGTRAAGKEGVSYDLWRLYCEIDDIPTEDVVKENAF